MGMTIYDKLTGEARQCENVDAREILESAPELYSADPVAKPDPLDHDEDGKKGGSKPRKAKGNTVTGDGSGVALPPILTRTEIEADLTAMNVDFDPALDDAALMALRDEARAIRDA